MGERCEVAARETDRSGRSGISLAGRPRLCDRTGRTLSHAHIAPGESDTAVGKRRQDLELGAEQALRLCRLPCRRGASLPRGSPLDDLGRAEPQPQLPAACPGTAVRPADGGTAAGSPYLLAAA